MDEQQRREFHEALLVEDLRGQRIALKVKGHITDGSRDR